jgi:hypothetical protein
VSPRLSRTVMQLQLELENVLAEKEKLTTEVRKKTARLLIGDI